MESYLEIFDLAAEDSRTLFKTARHIEAPNWTPGGADLIVNGDGKLFRVPLDAPDLLMIDTGPHASLNNDHGVSPDGKTLVICDKTVTPNSCIYTVPADGGLPRRITRNTPSWWHGWSPDGLRLTYTVVRDGQFGIATIPVTGGEETILIHSPHHYDGPDYTPDGQWIWFNSDRGGGMDLWRMRIDGTEPEQMTDDRAVNWFPHPSPDGRHVLYLAYPEGTEGHPPDREVTLRLIDLDSGKTRILTTLRGGQGTLNVPCWSPDSQRFAYMRYARA
ncbi:TolB family protein [Primorskyibacter marinus]|uniref:TolB family protein n=1 Tax=Primorskyibacter marinus TaxID=1977320 RepID=UPI000E2FF7C1|nr:TolB family protein [Primorskyibacter marinus]